jgi:hypothetical protein
LEGGRLVAGAGGDLSAFSLDPQARSMVVRETNKVDTERQKSRKVLLTLNLLVQHWTAQITLPLIGSRELQVQASA